MTFRPALILLALAYFSLGIAWPPLRGALEDRMAASARRDLETITELTAASLNGPLDEWRRDNPTLRASLGQAWQDHWRRVYFVDRSGRVHLPAGREALPSRGAAGRLLSIRVAAPGQIEGVWLTPYPGLDGQAVIGAWRWAESADLGVVAERPYDRFAQPLRWFDTAYGVLLAVLLGAGLYQARGLLFRRWAWGRSEAVCGPYILLHPLGEGAMSTVYLARHRKLGRVVALKRLKPLAQSDELSARFDREAALASRLNHPNLITVLDHGRAPGGGFFYAMEYIRGLTLTDWVERYGPLPPARALHLLRQLGSALAAMHERHLLHRDIKPDNVMAHAAHGEPDRLKLLDFGLIKAVNLDASRDLTRDVRVLGTPAFMAPERLTDPRRADLRTDLYGLGCIGFYLLTGRKPFEANQESDLMQQVLHVPAPSVSSLKQTPIALDVLIASLLEKDPERRPASAVELLDQLDQLAQALHWDRQEAQAWWDRVQVELNTPDARTPGEAA